MRTRRRARFVFDATTIVVVLLAIVTVEALFFAAGWLIGAFAGGPTVGLTSSREASVTQFALVSSPPAAKISADQIPADEPRSFIVEEGFVPAPPPPVAAATTPTLLLPSLSRAIAGDARSYEPIIQAAAFRHGLSPLLIAAVTRVESDFDPDDLSNKGARGLMQVMPETGARFGVTPDRLFDPAPNIAAGSAYLAWLLDRYRGDLDLALAAYNAGEGAVDRYRGIPPYRETQTYVRRVRDELAAMRRQ